MDRASGACVLCPPPLGQRTPVRAYSGHLTCEQCEDKISERLVKIATLYEKLNPRPSGMQAGDGTPAPLGFESKSPASEHIIAMMDHRSSQVAKVWVGSDGRIHKESERPVLSVYTTLLIEVYDVAERRQMALPDPIHLVRNLTSWLERHVTWLTAQPSVVDFADTLHALQRQLRPVVGERGKRPFGHCPAQLENPSRRCGGPLFPPPVTSSVIRCRKCGGEWDRKKDEWDDLGKQMRLVRIGVA